MTNSPKEWPIEEYRGVESSNHYRMVDQKSRNDPVELAKAHAVL